MHLTKTLISMPFTNCSTASFSSEHSKKYKVWFEPRRLGYVIWCPTTWAETPPLPSPWSTRNELELATKNFSNLSFETRNRCRLRPSFREMPRSDSIQRLSLLDLVSGNWYTVGLLLEKWEALIWRTSIEGTCFKPNEDSRDGFCPQDDKNFEVLWTPITSKRFLQSPAGSSVPFCLGDSFSWMDCLSKVVLWILIKCIFFKKTHCSKILFTKCNLSIQRTKFVSLLKVRLGKVRKCLICKN